LLTTHDVPPSLPPDHKPCSFERIEPPAVRLTADATR